MPYMFRSESFSLLLRFFLGPSPETDALGELLQQCNQKQQQRKSSLNDERDDERLRAGESAGICASHRCLAALYYRTKVLEGACQLCVPGGSAQGRIRLAIQFDLLPLKGGRTGHRDARLRLLGGAWHEGIQTASGRTAMAD